MAATLLLGYIHCLLLLSSAQVGCDVIQHPSLNSQTAPSLFPRCKAGFRSLSTLVVLGDSYSDAGRLNEPLANPYAALGNRSREPTWPLQLVKLLGPQSSVKLLDYGYNGAHANSHLTNLGVRVPDTREELHEYLEHLDSSSDSTLEAQHGTLVAWWIGVNSLDAIWQDACSPQPKGAPGAHKTSDSLFLNAMIRVDQQIGEVRKQLLHLNSALAERKRTVGGYVIFTVPNITSTPLLRGWAQKWSKGDNELAKQYSQLLMIIIDRYNDGLRKVVQHLNARCSLGWPVVVYEVGALWGRVREHPEVYGIENIYDVCFNGTKVCDDPDKYFYWDFIHPSPLVEELIARDLLGFIGTI